MHFHLVKRSNWFNWGVSDFFRKMSEYHHLRSKYCACCSKRCDKATKTNLRCEKNIDVIKILNTYKNTILIKNSKQPNNNNNIINQGDIICGKCRSYANNKLKVSANKSVSNIYPSLENESDLQLYQSTTSRVQTSSVSVQVNNPDIIEYPDEITLNIPRAMSTTDCIICKKSKNLIDVPEKAYVDTYIFNNILIPNDAKCCKVHLNSDKTFSKKDINSIEAVCDNNIKKQ
jgi:hypothetical protein